MEAVVPAPCWWTMMPRSVCTPSGIHSVYVTAIWSSPSAVDAGPDPDTPPIIPGPGSLPEGADAPPVLPGPGSLLELHPASTRLAIAATSASVLPPASFIGMPAVQAVPPRNRQGRTSWHPHRSAPFASFGCAWGPGSLRVRADLGGVRGLASQTGTCQPDERGYLRGPRSGRTPYVQSCGL